MATDSESPQTPDERESVHRDLAGALEAGQFFLVYQPTIDLQTNGFAGVEALLRWRHPTRGVLAPDAFFAELEASDQIVDVGRWTLDSACRQGALWHAKGYRFSVSVNVARAQFERPGFVDDVVAALAQSRFNPALLVLELGQRAVLAPGADTPLRLAALANLGVRLSVDDFVLGSSSMDTLSGVPVDVVKIARASIKVVRSDKAAAKYLHELMTAARHRGVRVVAAGVEDAKQRKALRLESVDVGQGYLFSRPAEVPDVDRFLEDFALFSGDPL